MTPYLTQPGKLGPWVALFKTILEFDLGPEFETQTESHADIERLNKSPSWQLKGIVAQVSLKLLQK